MQGFRGNCGGGGGGRENDLVCRVNQTVVTMGGFAVAAPLLHGRQRERAEVKFNKHMSLCTGGALHQIRRWGWFKTTTVLLKGFLHADVWKHQ